MATKLKARPGRISFQIRKSRLPIADPDPNTKEIFTNTLKDGKSGRRAWQRKLQHTKLQHTHYLLFSADAWTGRQYGTYWVIGQKRFCTIEGAWIFLRNGRKKRRRKPLVYNSFYYQNLGKKGTLPWHTCVQSWPTYIVKKRVWAEWWYGGEWKIVINTCGTHAASYLARIFGWFNRKIT